MTDFTPTFASTSPTRREAARVSALFHGHILASSTDVITVETPGGTPTRYFPYNDVGMSSLRAVDTIEDERGVATRYTIYRDGEIIENFAWSYDSPRAGFADLAGRIAFRDDPLILYEVSPLEPGEAAAAEPRSWDENLQPGMRDGVTATNSPDLAPGGGAGIDVDEVVRHTDSGSGASQAEHWPANVETPRQTDVATFADGADDDEAARQNPTSFSSDQAAPSASGLSGAQPGVETDFAASTGLDQSGHLPAAGPAASRGEPEPTLREEGPNAVEPGAPDRPFKDTGMI